jgi:hypothetical protein
MDRRRFIHTTLAIASAGAAGCISSGGGAQATIEPDRVELVRHGSGGGERVAGRVEVLNDTDESLGQVAATVTFIEGETRLGSYTAAVNGLDTDDRWIVDITSNDARGEDARAVDDVEAEVEERTPPSELSGESIEIVEDELVQEDGAVGAVGVAKNVTDEALGRATVVATFIDSDGVLVGPARTDTTRGVEAGQEFEFSIGYASSVREPAAVDGYQLTAEGG